MSCVFGERFPLIVLIFGVKSEDDTVGYPTQHAGTGVRDAATQEEPFHFLYVRSLSQASPSNARWMMYRTLPVCARVSTLPRRLPLSIRSMSRS